MSVIIRAILKDESPLAVRMELADAGTGGMMVVRVLRLFAKERGYKTGGAVSDGEAEEIVEASRICDCAEAGLKLLAYTDNSVHGLARKLRTKGYDRDTAEAAASALAEMGYINEASQIERRGRALAERKLRGKRRISAELGALGYDRDAIGDFFRKCDIDFGEICAAAITKKGGLPPREAADERRRLLGYLYRQGFSGDDIRAAVRILDGQK